MNVFGDLEKIKLNTLKEIWGYSSFRDSQSEIIDSILGGKDTIALLSTGGGKSICYQLPAIISEGVCIVISPLLALMKDQVERLRYLGIEAEYLSSELNILEEDEVYMNCKEGITKLLYISPERLTNRKFLMQVQEFQLSFIAVDEAHCISEWGQDFRPSYKNIKMFREQFFNVPCIALTATATPKVLNEITEKLGLKKVNTFKEGFKRDNIMIDIIENSDKYATILKFLRLRVQSGLIYTNTRKEAEELTSFLRSRNILNVDFYHSGLTKEQRHRKQETWQSSNINILISTNAFGMGIDKDNVRFVVHFNPPRSIENYYQEIGRAGRDSLESNAFLLWTEQDLAQYDDILKRQSPSKKEYDKVVSYLYSVFQIAENDFFEDKEYEFSINKFQKLVGISLAKIKSILEFLHLQEVIYFRKRKTASSLQLLIGYDEIDYLPKSDAYFIELLLRAITGVATHKVHFDEEAILEKLNIDQHLFNERIKEMEQKGYLEYVDGNQASIKFLIPRNTIQLQNYYYQVFNTMQTNKIRKWEEMKFFIQDNDFCKMKMILRYFGEKDAKNCGQCSYCRSQFQWADIGDTQEKNNILNALSKRASTLDEVCILIGNHQKEKVQEVLTSLLNEGRVRMLDFRTYTLA